jgi:hypothetical protein
VGSNLGCCRGLFSLTGEGVGIEEPAFSLRGLPVRREIVRAAAFQDGVILEDLGFSSPALAIEDWGCPCRMRVASGTA